MMKKWILFLTTASLVFGMTACDWDQTSNSGASEYTVKIADFDEYDDIYNIQMAYYNTGTIGRWETNTDEAYVNEGEGSAKWTMDASVAEVWQQTRLDCGQPMVAYYYFMGNATGVDLMNMSEVKRISVDCYNANDFDITFSGSLFTSETYTFANGSVTVKPGTWGTLTMYINEFIADDYLTSVARMNLTVNYAHQVMEEKTEVANVGQLYFPQAVVYLDNMYAVADSAKPAVNKNFEDENEVLYFNDIGDMKYVNTFLCNNEQDWLEKNIRIGQGVSASFNTNPCFTNGKSGSLQVHFEPIHNTRRDGKTNFTYAQYLAGVEFVGVVDNLDFLPMQTEGMKIAVDVYNDFNYDKEVFFGMDDNVNKFNYVTENEYPYEIGCQFPLYNMYKLKAKTWTTIYFDRAEALDLSRGVARIKFASSKLDVNQEGSFYLNNLRLVKEGN